MTFRSGNNRLPHFFLILLCIPLLLRAEDFPPRPSPPKLVNDLAGIIPDDKEPLLENKLVAYNDSTSTQIAVVTLTSIGGYDVSDYATRLGESWGVGQKDKDNGILILIAKEERATFIATGYGVEDRVPDILAGRIVDEKMLPYFKQGDFYEGINAASDALFGALLGRYKAEKQSKPLHIPRVIFIIIIVIVALIIISNRNGGGGQTISRRGPVFWGGPRIGGGFGGFGGGGFSGGGGFGGFGGGSFGGGGAGGRW